MHSMIQECKDHVKGEWMESVVEATIRFTYPYEKTLINIEQYFEK